MIPSKAFRKREILGVLIFSRILYSLNFKCMDVVCSVLTYELPAKFTSRGKPRGIRQLP